MKTKQQLLKIIIMNLCLNTIITQFSSKQITSMFLYYLLILINVILFIKVEKKFRCKNWKEVLAFGLINLYITFSFFGKSIFLPLGKLSIDYKDILIFLLMSIVVYPFIVNILYLFDKVGGFLQNKEEITSKVSQSYKFLLLIIGIQLPALLIFNPGLMTADSLVQYSQAHGYAQYSDHHPIFHTFLLSNLYKIWDNPLIVSLTQILINSIVIYKTTLLLKRLKYSNRCLYFYILIMTAMPNNFINSVTLWKDIPFTSALLYLTYLFAFLHLEKKNFYNKKNILQLIITLTLVVLLRHNGMVVLLGSCIFLIVQSFYYKNIRPFYIVLGSIILTFLVKTGLDYQLNAVPNGNIASVIPFHGIAYVYYEDENLNQGTEEYLSYYMPLDILKEYYHPYNANSYMYSDVAIEHDTIQKYREGDLGVTISKYLTTFFTYPYLIIKDRLYGTDLLWNPIQDNNDIYQYNYRYASLYDLEHNTFGIWHENFQLTDMYYRFLEVTSQNKYMDMFLWRGGIYIVFYLLLLLCCILRKKNNKIIILLPIVFNTASLLVSMAWQDYRYIHYLSFCFPFIILFILKDSRNSNINMEMIE